MPAALALLVALLPAAVLADGGDAAPKSNAPVSPSPEPEKHEPPAGDPVGVFTGRAYDTAEDLRVYCPDLDLVMLRSYSSTPAPDGALGAGWTHAYDWRVVVDGSRAYVHSSGERGPTDRVHVFSVPAPGSSASNSDGYTLRLSPGGLWSVETPDALTYSFDAANRLSSVSSWNGTAVAVSRDSSGRVLAATHSCGKSLSFEYGPNGLLSRVATPDPGVFAEYTYALHGVWPALVSAVRRDGARASTNLYRYASSSRPGVVFPRRDDMFCLPQRPSTSGMPLRPVLSGKTDANGITGSFSYVRPDDSPHVKCVRSSLSGGLFETSLDYADGMTIVESPFAGGVLRTVYRCDSDLRETSRATGDETLSRVYDSSGDVVSETLSNSRTDARVETRAGFDPRHRVVSVGASLGAVPTRFTALAWDDRRGIPNRVATPGGRIREWTTNGNEIVVYGAGAGDSRAVSRVFLDANERPVTVFGPDGGRADLARDESGYVTNAASSCLPPVSLAYDALGRVSSVSMPGPGGTTRTMSLSRNWRGKPLSVTRFDGSLEIFEYEGNGRRVTRRVDALGREDVYEWVLGLPVHAGRVIGGATNSLFGAVHDRQLNVVAITDPLGRSAETYVLDANERVVAVTNLEGQAMAREYLVGGLVASETRFDGTRVQYGYDRDGNIASVSYLGEALSFSYDPDGLMTSAANSSGTVSNSYDAATGWLVSSVGADGTEVSYSRRNGGTVSTMTSAAGTISYAYDAADRMTQVDSPAGTLNFGYCEWNGKLAAVTNASGSVVEYEYDAMDRVTNISWRTASGASVGGIAYEYDVIGRITARSLEVGTNAFNRVYAYDNLDRLASDGCVAYTYDAAGNRMTRTEDGATVTYTLGVGDRLASWTGGAYTHDAAGNVTRIERDGRPTLDLTWNSQYQLVFVSTNGVFAESYEYDALGRRVSTTTLEGMTRHVYDDNWQVVADIDANGNVIASYVWGDGIDNLLAVKIGGATYYPLTDIQGTVWSYIDTQNNIVARWQYDAWGNVTDEDVSAPALAKLRYRFQCREWSAATGLVNFRMRWYDAETGRWLSKDPIGLSGGLNLYAFCRCNPIGNVDGFGTLDLPTVIQNQGIINRILNPGLGGLWVLHHHVRQGLNDPLPSTPPADGKDGWHLLPPEQSVFHDNGDDAPECKFVNDDGREAVYDGASGQLITEDRYLGTYNFINPQTSKAGHFFVDVLPYLIMGN
jgi:RHS repeat-associated protein